MAKNKNTLNSGIDRSTLIGAAFLMATSAIGPGFLTQTATFTQDLGPDMSFAIIASAIISLIAQFNVWRIICMTGMPGQRIANKVIPGFGILISILVAGGGFVFNMGNIGGAGLGLEVLFGIDVNLGIVISLFISIFIFLNKKAGEIMDKLTTILGAIMIIIIAYVLLRTSTPLGDALKGLVMPSQIPWTAIITLVGGSVGGYITFSGAHRLLDTGKSGRDNLPAYTKSASLGIGVSTIVRILLYLAVLGVVVAGGQLGTENPAAEAFRLGAGELGYKLFGIVLFAAALSSTVGCSYTSISFLRDVKVIGNNSNIATVIFIAASALIMIFVGQPAALLVIAGAVNGLILPFTLGAMLIASQRKDIVGDYEHPKVLFILGIIVVIITLVAGVQTFIGSFS